MKVKNDHRSLFSNLSNRKEEAWKNQGFNGIRTRDPGSAIPVRCSTKWAMKPHIGSELSSTTAVHIWIISYKIYIMHEGMLYRGSKVTYKPMITRDDDLLMILFWQSLKIPRSWLRWPMTARFFLFSSQIFHRTSVIPLPTLYIFVKNPSQEMCVVDAWSTRRSFPRVSGVFTHQWPRVLNLSLGGFRLI